MIQKSAHIANLNSLAQSSRCRSLSVKFPAIAFPEQSRTFHCATRSGTGGLIAPTCCIRFCRCILPLLACKHPTFWKKRAHAKTNQHQERAFKSQNKPKVGPRQLVICLSMSESVATFAFKRCTGNLVDQCMPRASESSRGGWVHDISPVIHSSFQTYSSMLLPNRVYTAW